MGKSFEWTLFQRRCTNGHLAAWLGTLLVTREMQTQNHRCHFTPASMVLSGYGKVNVGDDVERLGPPYMAAVTLKWCSHYKEQFDGFSNH